MYSSAYVWAKIVSHIENRLDPITISTWFEDAEVVELNEDHLILYSSSDFRRNVISQRCTGYIENALKEIIDRRTNLGYNPMGVQFDRPQQKVK